MAKCSIMQFDGEDNYLWNEFVTTNRNAYLYLLWKCREVLYKTHRLRKCYLAVQIEKARAFFWLRFMSRFTEELYKMIR